MKTTKETLRESILDQIDAYRIENDQRGMGLLDVEPVTDRILELVESYAKSENEEKLKRLREKSFIALKSEMSRAIAWSIVEKELTREDK